MDFAILAALLAILGLSGLVYGWSRARPLALVGALSLATAALLAINALQTSRPPVRNPYPPTAASLQQGERLYRAHCQVCHGPKGRGDGPVAPALRPRPADLRRIARAPDQLLFVQITEGVPGTAMPAFRDRLTEEERWHVVNFLRHLLQEP